MDSLEDILQKVNTVFFSQIDSASHNKAARYDDDFVLTTSNPPPSLSLSPALDSSPSAAVIFVT